MAGSLVPLVVAICVCATAASELEAGPEESEDAGQMQTDQAYQEHVASLLSAISMSEGKTGVKYSDLKPQFVDVHTIAPRIPALRVGMGALGHNMLHAHSDESGKWSAEIMSSGLTAGFSLTDRRKGLQKGDGKLGSQWTMYSAGKIFRLKDTAAGDLLHVKDGAMILKGVKGKAAAKPRFTVEGGKDSVPRVTLVSKKGDKAKHVSLYNRHGKFGIFSGVMDKSIMHVAADGSELALTTANKQPHVLIESTAKSPSVQELILKGGDQSVKFYHKSGTVGFCGQGKGSKKCSSFFQATANGQQVDLISQAEKATLKISHRIKGGKTEVHLVSQDKVGVPTTTNIYNEEGTLGFSSIVKNVKKKLVTITPKGEMKVHGKLEVAETSKFGKDAHFVGNINVEGVVTMQGKSVSLMTSEMEEMKRENLMMKQRMEEMEQDTKEMQTRMTDMEQTSSALRDRMQRMMSAMELLQETTRMYTQS